MNDKYASTRLRGFQDASDALIKTKEEKLNKIPEATYKIEISIL